MDIVITINCDNDAFVGYPLDECARILGVVHAVFTNRIDVTPKIVDGMKLRDRNGNTVGAVEVRP